MATCGLIPFVSTFAVFAAGRAYDQIRNSICYPNLNVKICATHAGISVGEDGATHQMLEDLGLMRGLPNMTVLSVSDDTQTKWAIEEILKLQGPVYVRLMVSEAIMAKEELKKEGMDIRVVDIHTIKPIDKELIIKCAKETKQLFTVEDHSIIGGLGSAICEVLCEEYPTKVTRLGMKDIFGKSGKAEKLLEYFGLTKDGIIKAIKG